jgi:hypothetical protein
MKQHNDKMNSIKERMKKHLVDDTQLNQENRYSSTIQYYADKQNDGDEMKINQENNAPSDESVLENSVVNQKNISPSHESDLNQQIKSWTPKLLNVAANCKTLQQYLSDQHLGDYTAIDQNCKTGNLLHDQKCELKCTNDKIENFNLSCYNGNFETSPNEIKKCAAYSSADKLDNTSSVDDSHTSSLLLNGEEQSHAVIENDLETENGKVQDPNYIAININNVKNQSEGLADKKKIKQLEKELQDEKQNNINLTLKIKTNDLACKRKESELKTKLEKATEKYETLQSTIEASEKHMNNAHIELENKTTEILEKTVSAQSKYNDYDDEDKNYKREDDDFEEQVKHNKEKELEKELEKAKEETKLKFEEHKKYLEEEDRKEKDEEI